MNIFCVCAMFAILSKCITASTDTEYDAVKILEGEKSENLRLGRGPWGGKELYDHVVSKGPQFVITLIKRVPEAREPVLAALFDAGDKGITDRVLERVEHSDDDLVGVMGLKRELTGSPGKLFYLLSKIRTLEKRKIAISRGIEELLRTKAHDLIFPLIDAFEHETILDKGLRDVAIRAAFAEGASGNMLGIVETFYEHPAITSDDYAKALCRSWQHVSLSSIFPFLLGHADKGDLRSFRALWTCTSNWDSLRPVVGKRLKDAKPKGTRLCAFMGRIGVVRETFGGSDRLQLPDVLINIILEYMTVDALKYEEIEKGRAKNASNDCLMM